ADPIAFRMDLAAPEIAAAAHPGQFLHLRPVAFGLDLFLPRPFSVHRVLPGENGSLEGVAVFYRVVGGGTARLSTVKVGEEIQVLGPLGNGFSLGPSSAWTYLVAGGMGIAPLFFLAEWGLAEGTLSPDRTVLIYGARTAAELWGEADLRELAIPLLTATEDGTAGFHGTGLGLLEAQIEARNGPSRVYAVGPEPMYREMQARLAPRGIPCQVSVERRMACGLGVCRSCVIALREREGRIGYQDVCRKGPVFELKDLALEGLERSHS
ncbi:MAG: dihydroorotate dehydrogenase electron transfer subunit, partial [Planctomycetota bacterium]